MFSSVLDLIVFMAVSTAFEIRLIDCITRRFESSRQMFHLVKLVYIVLNRAEQLFSLLLAILGIAALDLQPGCPSIRPC
jgi:hypothetical protein